MPKQQLKDYMIHTYICLIMFPLHHMQVDQMTQQLQQMELATSPTTTGDETIATQTEMLDQGTYV